jgi:hypothetical protein
VVSLITEFPLLSNQIVFIPVVNIISVCIARSVFVEIYGNYSGLAICKSSGSSIKMGNTGKKIIEKQSVEANIFRLRLDVLVLDPVPITITANEAAPI